MSQREVLNFRTADKVSEPKLNICEFHFESKF